jgi:tRNA(Arg) A34 adenosine deaminase TadA
MTKINKTTANNSQQEDRKPYYVAGSLPIKLEPIEAFCVKIEKRRASEFIKIQTQYERELKQSRLDERKKNDDNEPCDFFHTSSIDDGLDLGLPPRHIRRVKPNAKKEEDLVEEGFVFIFVGVCENTEYARRLLIEAKKMNEEYEFDKCVIANREVMNKEELEVANEWWPSILLKSGKGERSSEAILADEDLRKCRARMDRFREIIINFGGGDSGVNNERYCEIVDPKTDAVIASARNGERDEGGLVRSRPMQHAAMIAIEKVAKLDLKNFPSSSMNENEVVLDERKENEEENDDDNINTSREAKKRRKSVSAAVMQESIGIPEKPYLCTGYDFYTTNEPCLMCAMALTHSRIKRIFYLKREENDRGALSSTKHRRLHGVKTLNHKFAVWSFDDVDEKNSV